MKIAGIIAEYNPFHKGHAYHVEQTRLRTGCDYVVVCMAGSFTQRGEAACADKWSRARAALCCGADAVFELPALFAVRTADAFARGGVSILSGLGCDCLSFGCETDDLQLISRLAGLRSCEPAELSLAIREKLDAGLSHARARGEALSEMLGVSAASLNAPNLVLAAEYLRAVRELGSEMQPVAVQRLGGYHDTTLGDYASASAIRQALRDGNASVAACLPPEARFQIENAGSMHDMDDMLLLTLRNMGAEDIAALPDVSEGLQDRVHAAAMQSAGREELIGRVKCKRYTYARISRLCAHALLGITQSLTLRHPLPEYARLIGFRSDAVPLMHELSCRTKLPIVSSATGLRENEIFSLECRATDVRALLLDDADARRGGAEYTHRFVRV